MKGSPARVESVVAPVRSAAGAAVACERGARALRTRRTRSVQKGIVPTYFSQVGRWSVAAERARACSEQQLTG